jgi:hypothetical protein
LAAATVPAPWSIVTPDDFHRRRPGEPIGYEPLIGDRIRYALRHSRWCSGVSRMLDDHDEQDPFGLTVTVMDIYARDGHTRYSCRDDRGQYSGIDLDWWIVEQVVEDGALW